MQTPFAYNYFITHDSLKIRYAHTEFKNNSSMGIILVLQGRAEFIEKYNDIAKLLIKKGYEVVTLDWRGQGLSERQVLNRHKGYVKNFDDYILDLKILYDIALKPQKQKNIFLLSHSMGGHIGLRFLHDYPNLIKKAVFVSPMFDIKTLLPQSITKSITQKACKSGLSEHYVFGKKQYHFETKSLNKKFLSHDKNQIKIQAVEIEKNPELALGGPTWGWLNAAYKSIDVILNKGYVSSITTPVLLVNAQKDKIVKRSVQERINHLLVNSSLISIKNAFHEILFEKKEIRNIFWNEFDQFIESKNI